MNRIDYMTTWKKPDFTVETGQVWDMIDSHRDADYLVRYEILYTKNENAVVDISHYINNHWIPTGWGITKNINVIGWHFRLVNE